MTSRPNAAPACSPDADNDNTPLPCLGPLTLGAAAIALTTVAPPAPANDNSGPIAMIGPELLRIACPSTPRPQLEAWAAAIRSVCTQYQIDNIRRICAFIAQMAHESVGFTRLNENLNYTSARRIKAVFGQGAAGRRRFPTEASCVPYVRQPEKLANYVYANRMGNGPPASGDGWKFRGGTPIHLTGRRNWTGFAKAIGKTLDEALAYGRTVEGGIHAAAWFWGVNNINRLADTPGARDESIAVNGGTNGLEERTRMFNALVDAMLRLERGLPIGGR